MPILFAHFITEIDNYSTEIKKKTKKRNRPSRGKELIILTDGQREDTEKLDEENLH